MKRRKKSNHHLIGGKKRPSVDVTGVDSFDRLALTRRRSGVREKTLAFTTPTPEFEGWCSGTRKSVLLRPQTVADRRETARTRVVVKMEKKMPKPSTIP
jgi:hypothetical protein